MAYPQKLPSGLKYDPDKLASYCHQNGIVDLAVFGSMLGKNFRADSDIDLLITFEPDAQIGFLALGRIQRELSDLFGREVDLVLQDGLKPAIRQVILESKEVLYAAG